MTDIDRRVAVEVMGWRQYKAHTGAEWCEPEDKTKGLTGTVRHLVCNWSPSTRIDHVWEAVEKLNLWSMEWHRMDDGRYDVTVWTDSDNPYGGLGETVAEGICKALLAAVEKQE